MDFAGLIKNGLLLLANVFGYQSDRSKLRNTPEMKQATEAQREAAAVDKTHEAIAKKDLNELRREAAE